MKRLARILFHVHTRDADAARPAVRLELDCPGRRKRAVVLRDLVALGEVRIEVVLAREDGDVVDGAAKGVRGAYRQFDGAAVQDGQGARHAEAHRADVGVGRRSKRSAAAAEDLRRREQLAMNLKADDRLERVGHGFEDY